MSASTVRFVTAIAAAVLVASAAHAQTAEEFYKGRQIQMVVGYEVGNDYDVGARMLARYMTKHLPGNPTIVVQNMPQAGGVVAANHLFLRAARDGSVIGGISRNLPSQAAMHLPKIEADPRQYNWLGATSFPGRLCAATANAPVKAMAEIFKTDLITGSVGAGSSTSIVPTVLNRVLGTKFKMIEGYRGAQDIILAMERGEVQGACMSYGQFRSHENLFRDGKLRFLFRAEESVLPAVPDVPSIYSYVKTDEQRQLMRFFFSSTEFGRPYLMPPGVPKDRVTYMRKVLKEAATDPELLAEAKKLKLDMTYRAPEHLEEIVAHLYETPPDVLDKIKKISPSLK